MGYSTDFSGKLTITPALSAPLVVYINKMAESRRVKRNLPDAFGIDGEFFVGGEGFAGQNHDASIIEYNRPPASQPGLWLQWNISEDGTSLQWDENEKFYEYVKWLAYLNREILLPLGYELSGEIRWRGEDFDDMGTITVQGALIMADGYDTIDCTPDESPRFLQCIKALKMGIPLLGERRTVDQLLNQLDDIADRVESRSKAQALSIRECTKRLREAVKE